MAAQRVTDVDYISPSDDNTMNPPRRMNASRRGRKLPRIICSDRSKPIKSGIRRVPPIQKRATLKSVSRVLFSVAGDTGLYPTPAPLRRIDPSELLTVPVNNLFYQPPNVLPSYHCQEPTVSVPTEQAPQYSNEVIISSAYHHEGIDDPEPTFYESFDIVLMESLIRRFPYLSERCSTMVELVESMNLEYIRYYGSSPQNVAAEQEGSLPTNVQAQVHPEPEEEMSSSVFYLRSNLPDLMDLSVPFDEDFFGI